MGKAHQDLFKRVPVFGEVFTAVVGDRAYTEDDVVFNLLAATPRPNRSAEEFKSPSLVNVWDNALFYHDGRIHDLRGAGEYMAALRHPELTAGALEVPGEYLRIFQGVRRTRLGAGLAPCDRLWPMPPPLLPRPGKAKRTLRTPPVPLITSPTVGSSTRRRARSATSPSVTPAFRELRSKPENRTTFICVI